jgi:hypothetical protein
MHEHFMLMHINAKQSVAFLPERQKALLCGLVVGFQPTIKRSRKAFSLLTQS